MSDSLIESCSFTSSNASWKGGCIHLKAANVTMKQNQLSGCESDFRGGSVYLVQQSALRLENVMINDSYSEYGGAIYVRSKSQLFLTDSVLTSSNAKKSGGIRCYHTGRVHLESLMISSCSSSIDYGCVSSAYQCNVTMDNITITDTDHAITVLESNINIFNSLALNDTMNLLIANSSDVTFWNLNISGTHIVLDESVAEFRHTLFMTPDAHCPIKDESGSNITLKSVYLPHTTRISQSESGIVCKGIRTVLHGNTSRENVIRN